MGSKPKQIRSSAFTWSIEDLTEQAHRLYKFKSINEDQYKIFIATSLDDKEYIMQSIIDSAQDHLIEYINEIISEGLYERFKSF